MDFEWLIAKCRVQIKKGGEGGKKWRQNPIYFSSRIGWAFSVGAQGQDHPLPLHLGAYTCFITPSSYLHFRYIYYFRVSSVFYSCMIYDFMLIWYYKEVFSAALVIADPDAKDRNSIPSAIVILRVDNQQNQVLLLSSVLRNTFPAILYTLQMWGHLQNCRSSRLSSHHPKPPYATQYPAEGFLNLRLDACAWI